MQAFADNGMPLDLDLDDAWVISDTHFLHARISEYEPIRQSLYPDHNEAMIARWREVIGPAATVLHLGDLALGKSEDFQPLAARLTGGRKLLLRGNHDRRSRAWYASHGFVLIPELWLEHEGWRVHVTHRPDEGPSSRVRFPRHLSLHGHVHSQTREDRTLINCSVEAMDFRPHRLRDVLDARIAELSA